MLSQGVVLCLVVVFHQVRDLILGLIHPRLLVATQLYVKTELLLQRSTAMQVRSSVWLMPQNQPSGRGLLLQRSTAVQVRSSVWLMPQNQPSGRGLLPSSTAWSPNQHHAAMLVDVSWHNLGRAEGRGLGFGQLFPHSHREVSEIPVLFRWALRPQCPVRRWKIVVCWARSSLQIGSRCA